MEYVRRMQEMKKEIDYNEIKMDTMFYSGIISYLCMVIIGCYTIAEISIKSPNDNFLMVALIYMIISNFTWIEKIRIYVVVDLEKTIADIISSPIIICWLYLTVIYGRDDYTSEYQSVLLCNILTYPITYIGMCITWCVFYYIEKRKKQKMQTDTNHDVETIV